MATQPNPKDSMKSTWRTASRDEWNINHWAIELLNVHPTELNKEIPVHQKDEKVPYLTQWSLNLWVLFYGSLPFLIHQVYTTFTGHHLGPIAVFNFYFFAFNAVVIFEVHILRRLGHIYGFLDGDKHERDGVPDVGIGKVVTSLYKTTGSRIALATYLTYNANQLPSQLNWALLPLQIGLYGIVLDFWFYWYHRLMHDVSFLWKFHRTHHLTKHPNPLLAAYADHEQEFFDMVGVPMATYFTLRLMGLPLGFYDWWLCHQYIAFTEVLGHSGLRLHSTGASTMTLLLEFFGAEIVIEDHDLHHRKGWRKSHNYGKQTRLWDRIFGTCHDRVEGTKDNIDYVNSVNMPLF
ncbi:hypothetical protein BDV37DRAFT_294426 [Aspergillus pseudonomiae]|uniref:Fatty acid hydroxylase domain-containing protein n=1 Tax=Aspergillus pseudonomiae TaxID=1506151 RepID=A0A5N7DAK3_9EURO|nr:uncharacterized protein BDV37DRAFT_294426 [Aspergillus pseudonomiae]KAE8403496.1 hypothetical protein BDV37DRAFT_294426 [Aspergillus pseudonomiae]